MDLIQYTLLSVSIAATLVSLALLGGLVAGFIIFRRVTRIFDQLEAMAHAGLEASATLKGFVEQTTSHITHVVQTFTTVQGAKEVVQVIGDTIRQARKNKQKKETTHAQSNAN